MCLMKKNQALPQKYKEVHLFYSFKLMNLSIQSNENWFLVSV